MNTASLRLLALAALAAAATPALAAGRPGQTFVPIPRCEVASVEGAAALTAGDVDYLPLDLASCGVPDSATSVLLDVRVADASAPARVDLVPGSRSPVAGTWLNATPGRDVTATLELPVEARTPTMLGARTTFPASSGGHLALGISVRGYYEEASTFSGATGFIRTRPTCVPPKYTPDALNYLQGPEPILLPGGDVSMLVGTGRCCLGTRHWEGVFSLTYPAAEHEQTPRFRPLWATNDFSQAPKRKEAELGFPSALFYAGKWRIGLVTTFLPFHQPNADRASRLDLADLVTRATPGQVTNTWVQPIDAKCKKPGSCPGQGSGIDPVLTLHPNGDLFLYHRDGNYPACPSGYIRHRVAADLSVVNSRDDGCLRFEGLTQAPFLISDIARTADGRLVLLVGKLQGLGSIAEWESTGGPAEIGLLWKPTGRVWTAPEHPQGSLWAYYVRDAAYLKDPTRTVVEPEVVVAQISDGRTYQEMVDVAAGRWYLYYWAEDGAVLPPTFGGPASSCALQGAHEATDCTSARGWAWDPSFPSSPISVDVLVDGKVVATVAADLLRTDLANKGDGRHGFTWPIPASLRDGKAHKVTVRYAESVDALTGKTKSIACK